MFKNRNRSFRPLACFQLITVISRRVLAFTLTTDEKPDEKPTLHDFNTSGDIV